MSTQEQERSGTRYGEAPAEISATVGEWLEHMTYLYLPVRLAGSAWAIPPRLAFAEEAILAALDDARFYADHLHDPYLYVTAKRGWASPGHSLNRPGWHTDGFGTDDLNYVWCDGEPTEFAVHPFEDIVENDARSLEQFEAQACVNGWATPGRLYRLTPYVVHRAPEITVGHMRSFLKVSVSNHRYNLIGNSHNYELDYDWPMYPREAARNDPTRAADFVDEPSGVSV